MLLLRTGFSWTLGILSAVFIAFIVDVLLVRLYSLLPPEFHLSGLHLVMFGATVILFSIAGIFFARFISKSSNEYARLKIGVFSKRMNTGVIIVHFTLVGMLFSILIGMGWMDRYFTSSLIIICTISYVCSALLMAYLAYRFLAWYRLAPRTVILFYFIASTMVTANVLFTVVLVDLVMVKMPSTVYKHTYLARAPFIPHGSVLDNLNALFNWTSIGAFVFWWTATAILLSTYSKYTGRTRYWIIAFVPLIIFIIQFIPFSNLSSIFGGTSEAILAYNLGFALIKPLGGILFGISFWLLMRNLEYFNKIRNLIITAAFGLMFLFASNQGIILVAFSYPPYGVAAISFIPMAAYGTLIGIYGTAIVVSQNAELRKTIRKIANEHVSLMDGIGMAVAEEEIRKRVTEMEERFKEDNSVPKTNSEMSDTEVKNYINEVLNEIKKSHGFSK